MKLESFLYKIKRLLTPPRRDEVRDLRKALLAGFICGPLGIGIYLRSWADLIASIITFIVLNSVLKLDGPRLDPLFWFLWGTWAVLRARHLNQALQASNQTTPTASDSVAPVPIVAVEGDTPLIPSSDAPAAA